MSQLDEISLAIGRLQGGIDGLFTNQANHQKRDDEQHAVTQGMVDKLIIHVNHENEGMDKRLVKLERRDEARHTRWLMMAKVGAAVIAVSSVLALVADIFKDYIFGKGS